jgi:hypothetical protein
LEDRKIIKIILKRICKKFHSKHDLDLCSSGYERLARDRECGNEPSGSIIWREFLD